MDVRDDAVKYRVRERQWMYLGPILAAPVAHVFVTLYQSAKTPAQKRLFLTGVVGSTVSMLAVRFVLMYHSGYPGAANSDASNRIKKVTSEEKHRMENPSVFEIAKEVFKGFG